MTDHPTTAARDLYEAILREPWDDAHRLVFADYLDENPRDDGDRERAEFIRAQINGDESYSVQWMPAYFDRVRDYPEMTVNEWNDSFATRKWANDLMDIVPDGAQISSHVKWRRGFPAEIAVPIGVFMGGGECDGKRCDRGQIYIGQDNLRWITCTRCHGTGSVPGLAASCCKRWPLERVTLAGKEPWYERGVGGEHCWWRESVWSNRGGHSRNEVGNLPDVLFEKIAELYPDNRLSWSGPPHNQHIGFDSREAAIDALSRAAVAHARGLAGLPVHDHFRPQRERIEQFQ